MSNDKRIEPDAHQYRCEFCDRPVQRNKKQRVLKGVKCAEHHPEGKFTYDKPLFSAETIQEKIEEIRLDEMVNDRCPDCEHEKCSKKEAQALILSQLEEVFNE